jgi:hypothetical protein
VLHVLARDTSPAARLAPEVARQGLRSALASIGLVVLDLCSETGAQRTDPGHAYAFAAEGVACVAPSTSFAPDPSMAFSRGLYAALASGSDVAQAVAEGRHALRQLDLARAACRWWNPVLVVPDLGALNGPPPLRHARCPAGWPAGDRDAGAVVEEALARGDAQGFLGVEHLAMALVEAPGVPAALGRVLRRLGDPPGPWLPEGPPRTSPRLAAMGPRLRPGYTVDDLVRAMLEIAWVAACVDPFLLARLQGPTAHPVRTPQRTVSTGVLLEVEGGPEDGRRLAPRAGDVIGRFDPAIAADLANRLFWAGVPPDRTVSRHHVVWEGGRTMRALAPVRGCSGGQEREMTGAFELHEEDVVCLGAVRLRVLRL